MTASPRAGVGMEWLGHVDVITATVVPPSGLHDASISRRGGTAPWGRAWRATSPRERLMASSRSSRHRRQSRRLASFAADERQEVVSVQPQHVHDVPRRRVGRHDADPGDRARLAARRSAARPYVVVQESPAGLGEVDLDGACTWRTRSRWHRTERSRRPVVGETPTGGRREELSGPMIHRPSGADPADRGSLMTRGRSRTPRRRWLGAY